MPPLTSYLIETLLTLFAVLVLAVIALYAARKVGVGRPSGPMALLGRLPLDGRRGVYLVKVAEVVYVIGSSEAGLVKLGELGAGDLPLGSGLPSERTFGEILREKLLKNAPPSSVSSDGDEGAPGAKSAQIAGQGRYSGSAGGSVGKAES